MRLLTVEEQIIPICKATLIQAEKRWIASSPVLECTPPAPVGAETASICYRAGSAMVLADRKYYVVPIVTMVAQSIQLNITAIPPAYSNPKCGHASRCGRRIGARFVAFSFLMVYHTPTACPKA